MHAQSSTLRVDSSIASTFRLHSIDGFYAVYGCRLKNIDLNCDEVVLGYVTQLGQPPPIFEVVPTGQNSAYCVIFVFSKALLAPNTLALLFERHCQHNPFFSMTEQTERGPEKAGAIPIGRSYCSDPIRGSVSGDQNRAKRVPSMSALPIGKGCFAMCRF